MTRSDFAERTEEFAVRIYHLFCSLPKRAGAYVLGNQFLRSGTSIGAHYAEAQHSRSVAEFTSKIDGARQEAQETIYWLRLVLRLSFVEPGRLQPLIDEAMKIRAILMSMSSRARKHKLERDPV